MKTFLKASALASAAIFASTVASPVFAQAKTPAAIIVTVDNEKILSECNACKAAQMQLQSQAQQIQTLSQTLGQPLQTEAEAIQKAAGGKAPDAALQARIQALQTKEASANQQLQTRQQQFQRNRGYVVQQIQPTLGPFVQQVMQSKGANLAIDVGSTIAAAASLDVTTEVLAQLNAQLPSVSTTAPAAAAAPATGGR